MATWNHTLYHDMYIEPCKSTLCIHISVGIRLIGRRDSTDITEASALGHMTDKIQIYSNSWGPHDDGRADGQPGELLSQVLETAARTVRSDVLCMERKTTVMTACYRRPTRSMPLPIVFY